MANQDIDSHEYNGHPNFSSWNILLWRSNDEYTEKCYERIVANTAKYAKALGLTEPELPSELKYILPTLKAFYHNVWLDYAKADGCRWRNIKWDHVFDIFIEDVGYAIKG